MMDAAIRTATAADLDPLLALVHRAYRGESARGGWTHEADLLDGQRTDPAALGDILADPAQLMLVAEQQGVMVGCVQIADRGDETAYLGLLSVDPEHQAAGLGRRLLAAAEHAAADHFGARQMEMSVIRQRNELIAYYERRGYSLTGEERPFPHEDPRFGLPRRGDLAFAILSKRI